MQIAENAPTTNPSENVLGILCQKLEPFNSENVKLSADTDIAKELNIDSVAILELVFELEEYFDVSVPINALADISTIGELAALIEESIQK